MIATLFTSSTRDVPEVRAVPRHIAIIMDGNGRWAKQRMLPRVAGHRKGVEAVRATVRGCIEQGVEYLTLFAFSSENWRRPADEVSILMQLFLRALEQEVAKLDDNDIRFKVIGDISRFEPRIRELIAAGEAVTEGNSRLTLTVAANYGGRWDVAQAVQKLLATEPGALRGFAPEALEPYLSMAYAPEPDLFIRTGGEQRISNFLLWQLAYTEFFFTDLLWPDFDAGALSRGDRFVSAARASVWTDQRATASCSRLSRVLKTRIITALVLIPLTLAALFGLPPRAWGAVTLAVVVVAAAEWAELAALEKRGWLFFVGATLFTGCVLLLDPAAGFTSERGWPGPMVSWICGAATVFWLLVAPAWLVSGRRVTSRPVLAIVGWLVLIATWVAVVALQTRSPGVLLAMMAIVWIADTAAYFTGRRFGRRKLAPSISPGKTWEGVYGALAAVAIYALLLVPLAAAAGSTRPLDAIAAAIWVALALLLTGLSIIGDLFESQLKRQRGVKDSGGILPGHGGVLDRIDALTAAMPPAALIAHHLLG